MFYVIKNNNKRENKMKKKILYLFLTIVSVVSLIGCGNSESSEEASEAVSATQGNALESAFLSEDHFELREESITIEYGTPLSDDISEYVIAKDYEGITCEYEEISTYSLQQGENGMATFTKDSGEQLTMTILYTDTTPPTIARTEYTYYTIQSHSAYSSSLYLEEIMAPENLPGQPRFFRPSTFIEFFGIDDNSFAHVSGLSIDGISYELDEEFPAMTTIPALDYGSHTIVITVYDVANSSETFECTLNIVAEISPEERELILSDGHTEEAINTAMETLLNQN